MRPFLKVVSPLTSLLAGAIAIGGCSQELAGPTDPTDSVSQPALVGIPSSPGTGVVKGDTIGHPLSATVAGNIEWGIGGPVLNGSGAIYTRTIGATMLQNGIGSPVPTDWTQMPGFGLVIA